MTYRPDDHRALFKRVVDDICDQIRSGELGPEDRVPSAKQISDKYAIANMTAQRALRELQGLGLTYGIPGKGSFVRPDARENLPVGEITDDATYVAVVQKWSQTGDDLMDAVEEAVAAGDMKRIKTARNAFTNFMNASTRSVLAANAYYNKATREGRDIEGRDALLTDSEAAPELPTKRTRKPKAAS